MPGEVAGTLLQAMVSQGTLALGTLRATDTCWDRPGASEATQPVTVKGPGVSLVLPSRAPRPRLTDTLGRRGQGRPQEGLAPPPLTSPKPPRPGVLEYPSGLLGCSEQEPPCLLLARPIPQPQTLPRRPPQLLVSGVMPIARAGWLQAEPTRGFPRLQGRGSLPGRVSWGVTAGGRGGPGQGDADDHPHACSVSLIESSSTARANPITNSPQGNGSTSG